MGFFDRLTDFGDREQVKTAAMRINGALLQLDRESDIFMIRGISSAIAQEVQRMQILASKLTMESINCLNVPYRGNKIPYTRFIKELERISSTIVGRGGYAII